MTYNLLMGKIPSSLMNATSLKKLLLDNNSFHGLIPKTLGRLKGLEFFVLGLNQLQDDISFISSLANCSSVDTLTVESNLIRGWLPTSISNLSTSIKRIFMANNHIQGTIPSALQYLYNLSVLSLGNNLLTNCVPDSIGALHSLQGLSLSRNTFIGEIPSLIGNRHCYISLTLPPTISMATYRKVSGIASN